jgi:hypothetical protein
MKKGFRTRVLQWSVFLRLLATWALQSVAGQHRISWVQRSVSEVAPLWGVKTGRCVLGWSEVSHLCS